MRFVAVKSEAQQASALVFRARDLIVRQRTQTINALRSHMAEYGWIAPKGPSHMASLAALIEQDGAIPDAARDVFRLLLDSLGSLDAKLAELDKEIARRAREDAVARRLMTIPGVGPITATAIAALAPAAESFARAGTLPPGSGSRRASTRPAASRSSARSRRWESVPSGGCSLSAAAQWCAMPASMVQPAARGSSRYWRASRACCDGRTRQQDRADRLGGADQERGLQGSGRGHGVSLAGLRSSEA